MKRAALFAAASILYAVAAWAARPGFYDCCAGPSYAYVSPPPLLESGNVQPRPGAGTVPETGGVVATGDQPSPQATIQIAAGALQGQATIEIKPFAPPPPSHRLTITGNVYCITSSAALRPGATAQIRLLVPPYQPFPNAMYQSPQRDGPWTSVGARFDQGTYFMTAQSANLGCFAVGYATPKASSSPRLGGAVLPILTAILIAIVLLAGLPAIVRRRSRRSTSDPLLPP